MDKKLKPCPFCGGENVEVYRNDSPTFVTCFSCDVEGPEAVDPPMARKLWNTRAAQPVQPQPSAWEQLTAREQTAAKSRWADNEDERGFWNDTTREKYAAEILAERKPEQAAEPKQSPRNKWADVLSAELYAGNVTEVEFVTAAALIDIAESLAKLAGR